MIAKKVVARTRQFYKIEVLEKYAESLFSQFTIERHCLGEKSPLVNVANLLLYQFKKNKN